MIGALLAAFSFSGGNFADLLMQLDQMGFFTLVLPFLLIFVIIFGVLTNIKVLGENKAVNAVIAFSVGLMALQFGFVTQFFGEIFPRLGVWLAVILVIIIIFGLFNKGGTWPIGIMIMIGGVIAAIVISSSFNDPFFNYGFPLWITSNLGWIIPVAVIGGVIAWAWSSQAPKSTTGIELVKKMFETGK